MIAMKNSARKRENAGSVVKHFSREGDFEQDIVAITVEEVLA